jgi:hypothetical protein
MNREDEYYDVLGQKQLAALKREMLPCFESAVVSATHKVMAELEQENSVTDHELRDCPRCGHCCPQSEQEPIKDRLDFWALFDENQRLRAELKLNTTPPQQWVGLTDDEVQEIMEKTVATCSELDDFTGDTARLTWKNCEAKLREKNGG